MSYLKHFPKPLLDDLVKNRWIPIVGAGFSLNAVPPEGQTVPLWEDLGKALAKDLGDYYYSTALEAISAYSHEYSRAKLVERLFELLLIGKVRPGEAHRAFCSVQFDVVCTTNFDFLLDRQYEQSPRYCLPILDEDQLSVNSLSAGNRDARRDDLTVTLLKLHGDLHHPQRLIVTEEDYDLFLQRYPLLATHLSSLLIERTAVLVGYSLNDYDFRQVWQVVGERLGKMRRPAYSLAVNPRPAEVAGFERRGVKVIRLPGPKSKYSEILAKTFDELREYWTSNVISISQVTEEDSLKELSLPRDAATRLCFFSIPLRLYSFYRDRVFPLARRYGFVPVTTQDIVSPGDSVVAVVEELARRASTAVLDMGNRSSATEARLALSVQNFEGVVVVTEQKAGDAPDVLLPSHQPVDFTIRSLALPPWVRRLMRPSEPFDKSRPFLDAMEGWFSSLAADLGSRLEEEPVRLLRVGEYKAAVVSAMTQLEVALRERLERDLERYDRLKGLGQMLGSAERYEVLDPRTLERVRRWSELRNAAVHTMRSVDPDTANEVVHGILEVIQRLRGHAD